MALLLVPIYVTNHWILVSITGLSTCDIVLTLWDPKYKRKYFNVLAVLKEYLILEHTKKKMTDLDANFVLNVPENMPIQNNDLIILFI